MRNRARQFTVSKAAVVQQTPQEDNTAIQENNPKGLDQWLKSLEQEDWWLRDNDEHASKNNQRPEGDQTEATVNVLRLSTRKYQNQRGRKASKSTPAPPTSILKKAANNKKGSAIASLEPILPAGEGHSRNKCIQNACPHPHLCETQSRATRQKQVSATDDEDRDTTTHQVATEHMTPHSNRSNATPQSSHSHATPQSNSTHTTQTQDTPVEPNDPDQTPMRLITPPPPWQIDFDRITTATPASPPGIRHDRVGNSSPS